MSTHVNVLAVMDKAWAATPGDAITLRVEIDDARAAVAELIEVAQYAESALSLASSYRDITRDRDGMRIETSLAALRTAIANVRSAS